MDCEELLIREWGWLLDLVYSGQRGLGVGETLPKKKTSDVPREKGLLEARPRYEAGYQREGGDR